MYIAQFIKVLIRMIDFKLTKKHKSLEEKFPNFNQKLLSQWGNTVGNNDSSRIIIPRVLYSMYCIRNKRGSIHVSNIASSEMDATLLLNNMKWILAEFFRLSNHLEIDRAYKVINCITEKEYELV